MEDPVWAKRVQPQPNLTRPLPATPGIPSMAFLEPRKYPAIETDRPTLDLCAIAAHDARFEGLTIHVSYPRDEALVTADSKNANATAFLDQLKDKAHQLGYGRVSNEGDSMFFPRRWQLAHVISVLKVELGIAPAAPNAVHAK